MRPTIGRALHGGRILPLLLLALLVVGTAAHLGHHWLEPECGTESGPASHPCVACSAMHAAAEPDADITAQPPAAHADSWLPRSATMARDAAVRGATSPRAPPLA